MPKNYNRVNKRRQYKLNWKPSPFDPRDFKSERHNRVVGQILPAEFMLPRVSVYDQKNLGSCTSNSGCLCYKFEAFQLNKSVEPSRLFLYYNTREIEGTVNEDSGAYIRDVFKALNKRGLCEEKYFPYVESTFKNKPSQEAYDNGLKYQTVKYTAVPKDLTQIKQTIYSGAVVSFGFTVYSSFFGSWDRSTGVMPIPKKGERIEGGHATSLIGWSDSKKCFIVQNSWGCYDEKTEVLTESGFKLFKDVLESDLIATLNPEGELVYQNYTDRTEYKYTGNMKKYLSSKCDLLVTPNHNMYIKSNKKQERFDFVTADNISNKRFVIKRDAVWKGEDVNDFYLPEYERNLNTYTKVNIPALQIDMELFLEFLGYYLSEGSLSVSNSRKGGRQYYVNISQIKEDNRTKIENLLKKLPFNYWKGKKTFTISNQQLYLYLSQFGLSNDKFIPNDILNLPPSKLKILYDALMLGDGSIQKSNNSHKVTYYTTSKQLCDDIQELCLKLGYTSSIYEDDRIGTKNSSGYNYNLICYQVRIQNSFEGRNVIGTKEHTIINNQEDVDYNGMVYCLTVPNHTLFIRRNGKTCWCGNSDWGQQGIFYMPYDFFMSKDTDDYWCIDEIKIEDSPTPTPPTPPTPYSLDFKQGLKNVLTKPDLIKMSESLVVNIGKQLGIQTDMSLTKSVNVDLVWNYLAS